MKTQADLVVFRKLQISWTLLEGRLCLQQNVCSRRSWFVSGDLKQWFFLSAFLCTNIFGLGAVKSDIIPVEERTHTASWRFDEWPVRYLQLNYKEFMSFRLLYSHCRCLSVNSNAPQDLLVPLLNPGNSMFVYLIWPDYFHSDGLFAKSGVSLEMSSSSAHTMECHFNKLGKCVDFFGCHWVLAVKLCPSMDKLGEVDRKSLIRKSRTSFLTAESKDGELTKIQFIFRCLKNRAV